MAGKSADTRRTQEISADTLSIETSSGKVSLTLPEKCGFTLDYDTGSGEFTYDIPLVKQGGKYVSGDGKADFEIGTGSGDVSIKKK